MTSRLLALALLAALGGCATPGPQALRAPPITPAAAGLAETSTDAVFPQQAWWRALGDPALDALIATALAGQP
ncbi:MAG: hypothetical protein Q7U09_07650, partial [Hydrogenophaga sp.]|nr:hypothetical protein [Hydrogenophaga sp.]